jgi:hypothetical protein
MPSVAPGRAVVLVTKLESDLEAVAMLLRERPELRNTEATASMLDRPRARAFRDSSISRRRQGRPAMSDPFSGSSVVPLLVA